MTNQFAPFAADPAAEVMPIEDYLATGFTTRLVGFTTGTALSHQLNRVWRQASLISSMIADFTVTQTGDDMLDDGTPANRTALQQSFTDAIVAAAAAGAGSGYLPLSGGTLTGDLTISKAGPVLMLNASAGNSVLFMRGLAATSRYLQASTGVLARWQVHLADPTVESGGNAGSNFLISRFNDAGAFLDSPMGISRSSGVVNFARAPTVAGSAMPYLPLAGGVLSGTLVVGGNGTRYAIAGGANFIGFGWTGSAIRAWVNGTNIGDLATTAYVGTIAGAYVPLAGGTMSGPLTINSSLQAGFTKFTSSVVFANDDGFTNFSFVSAGIGYKARQWQANWWDGWRTSDGLRIWASPTGWVMNMTGAGGLTISGPFNANGGKVISASSGSPSVVGWHQAGGSAMGFYVAGGHMWFAGFDGNGNATVNLGQVDTNGSLSMVGSVFCSGLSVSGGAGVQNLWVSGQIDTAGTIYAGALWSRGNVYAGNAGDFYLAASGSARILNFASNHWFSYDGGSLRWYRDGNEFMTLRSDQQFAIYSDACFKYGGGGWYAISDARVKTIDGTYTGGLDEIRRLVPLWFRYTADAGPGVNTDQPYIGLAAQDVLPVMPEMIKRRSDDDLLSTDTGPLTYAMLNAIKQLDDRLLAMEAKGHG